MRSVMLYGESGLKWAGTNVGRRKSCLFTLRRAWKSQVIHLNYGFHFPAKKIRPQSQKKIFQFVRILGLGLQLSRVLKSKGGRWS